MRSRVVVSQISSGFQRAGSEVVRICSHLHLPPCFAATARHHYPRSRIHRISVCLGVLDIRMVQGNARIPVTVTRLRRPCTYAVLANHDTDAQDRRMTTSVHYHPAGFIRFAIYSCDFTISFFYYVDFGRSNHDSRREDRWARMICRSRRFMLLDDFVDSEQAFHVALPMFFCR